MNTETILDVKSRSIPCAFIQFFDKMWPADLMKLLIFYGVLGYGLKEINAEFLGTFASGRTLAMLTTASIALSADF